MNAFFDAPQHLQALPTTRAAYSDRAAWMMCEMSELAYLPFEGENRFRSILTAIDGIAKVAKLRKDNGEISKQIEALRSDLKRHIDQKLAFAVSGNAPESSGLRELKAALGSAGFQFARAFNESDTQAFLAKRNSDKIAVLAFRGTETNNVMDVKTDLNARFYKGEGGAKIHSGFHAAYLPSAVASQGRHR